MEKITSSDNKKIKNIIKLRKAGERKKQNLVIVEGKKELELALLSGFEIIDIFCCNNFIKDKEGLNQFDKDLITLTGASVFKKISYRDKPDGFLALAKPSYMGLKDLQLSLDPLIVVLEAVEKPGNLGAVLRSADAVGADAVIINGDRTDIFNPNVIRASRGTVFSVQTVKAGREETIKFLKEKNIAIYASALSAKRNYLEVDFKKGSAIVFGTEDKGLSDDWINSADELIKIPMKGSIDSLNVSVSAGVIIFEALRQRKSD
jgi:TrmH family RNA methyltransferase